MVLPPQSVPDRPDPTGKLPTWTGQPLDPKNLGATLEQGTVLCLIGEPKALEAVMLVDQSEMEFIAKGEKVELKLDAFPWRTIEGEVEEIAETEMEASSERLSVKAGGQLPTETDPSGREAPISTTYEVSMRVDDPDGLLTAGMRGTAKVQVGQRTVGGWLLRLLWQTFNFRL